MLLRRRKLLRATEGAIGLAPQSRGLPGAYGGRGGNFFKDIYDADHLEQRQGGRFRWMLSTCLAATVGAIAILVVVYGSADENSGNDGLLPALISIRDGTIPQPTMPTPKNADGLKWVAPKADRLQLTSGALSTRYIIHESTKSRRDGREYVRQKPYARIVARLAPVPSDDASDIPAFNPFKLYANTQPVSSNDDADTKAGSGLSHTDVSVKVVELLGGILPGEDGQELDSEEVQELVENSAAAAQVPADGIPLDGDADVTAPPPSMSPEEQIAWQPKAETSQRTNTTDIYKSPETPDDPTDDFEGGEISVVTVGRTDTLAKILSNAGADAWQVRAMIEAAHTTFPESALVPGQEVRMTLVPSLTQADKKEPARFSVFSDGHDHLVTVSRNAAGEFVASAQPTITEELMKSAADGESATASTLYASLYHAGLMQNLAPETIGQILRVNAFDTDFRRRVRPGDTVELFFDMKDEQSTDGPPGELLYSAINSGGTVYRFYRFRTHDGQIDYYDEQGNNSKKFLMRKPVRGDDVRLTSGFGVRYHPLLNVRKMHTGVDWAADPGTPILASGTGVIEEAGHKGYNGNYIRIRHPNGYHTAYSHMSKIASGITPGVKVRQGQVIGFVGSTGLSSGPHLHFEVLVNSRFVDPMSIQVPRERKLDGKELAEFQRERARIDELMRRAPVMTANK
ncbi:MAG: M23 family metallopeptidase [Hyphomicrobium sp.]|nr:M23 family metallopeptidase [Hyphomicrobium sp.]